MFYKEGFATLILTENQVSLSDLKKTADMVWVMDCIGFTLC